MAIVNICDIHRPCRTVKEVPSNFKVGREKQLPIVTQIGRFRTVKFEITDGCEVIHKAWSSIK